MSSGGGGGGESRTVTTQELSPEQQELLSLVIPEARKFVQKPPQQFPGSAIAPFTPNQLGAQQGALSQAFGGNVGQVSDAAAQAQQFALGPVLFPESNPALRAATDAAIRPITEQFTQSVLPNIRQGAITAGGFGGSRQGIAEGAASQAFLRQVGDTSAQIQSEAFGQGLDLFGRSLFAAPGTAQLALLPTQLQEAVGIQQQQQQQNLLTEQAQKFVNKQLIPFAAAQDVAGLAFGFGGGTATSTTTGAQAGGGIGSSITGALSGAAGGAALAGMMSLSNPATAALAGLGALAGLFS